MCGYLDALPDELDAVQGEEAESGTGVDTVTASDPPTRDAAVLDKSTALARINDLLRDAEDIPVVMMEEVKLRQETVPRNWAVKAHRIMATKPKLETLEVTRLVSGRKNSLVTSGGWELFLPLLRAGRCWPCAWLSVTRSMCARCSRGASETHVGDEGAEGQVQQRDVEEPEGSHGPAQAHEQCLQMVPPAAQLRVAPLCLLLHRRGK